MKRRSFFASVAAAVVCLIPGTPARKKHLIPTTEAIYTQVSTQTGVVTAVFHPGDHVRVPGHRHSMCVNRSTGTGGNERVVCDWFDHHIHLRREDWSARFLEMVESYQERMART